MNEKQNVVQNQETESNKIDHKSEKIQNLKLFWSKKRKFYIGQKEQSLELLRSLGAYFHHSEDQENSFVTFTI